MFDIGFWELLLIFGMGLLILGPERMPRVAAQIGRWIGRAQRTANQFRRKLQRELELEDLMRDGIVPRHGAAARPKTTTRTGNTPTTVPANAGAAGAETGGEASAKSTAAGSAQPGPDAPGPDAPGPDAPGPDAPGPDAPGQGAAGQGAAGQGAPVSNARRSTGQAPASPGETPRPHQSAQEQEPAPEAAQAETRAGKASEAGSP